MEIPFNEIKEWTWIELRPSTNDHGPFTMLIADKISDDKYLNVTHGSDPEDTWVEGKDILSKDEWESFQRDRNVTVAVYKGHPEWKDYARNMMKKVFMPNIDIWKGRA